MTQAHVLELNVWKATSLDQTAKYDDVSGTWALEVSTKDSKFALNGDPVKRTLKPRHIVLAIGHAGGSSKHLPWDIYVCLLSADPQVPEFKDRQAFTGPVLHSSQYKSGREFKGKKASAERIHGIYPDSPRTTR